MKKEYYGREITEKWLDIWNNNEEYQEIFRFDRTESDTKFIIDTPPPFTTGNPHMGHALWWVLNDTIGRFKRMQGHNVLLPQGWDCQGLPTEVKVEEEFGISPQDTEAFLEKCHEYTEEMIEAMKSQMIRLGYMPDWSYEYRTMDDSYHELVQRSLLRFEDQDLVYKQEFPNHWCPECETAIAKAEIDRETREADLIQIGFPLADGSELAVATTRPELLPACVSVAVHPDDERFAEYVGRTVTVPLTDREVPIIADEDVDSDFGTGAVMICTFGDEEDRNWVYDHDLDIIESIDKSGRLTGEMGAYEGLTIPEARKQIVPDLSDEGFLQDRDSTTQERGLHDRCDTPVEIILTEQWFINVLDSREKLIELGGEIEWLPDYMEKRYDQWTESLNWDWCISRQRSFGTPLPFWSCPECGEIHRPAEEDLPIDPRTSEDFLEECIECGHALEPCRDVADCWVDSSVSALRLVEWEDYDNWEELYPVELREQGHDIIRTWAFYSIFRCFQLTDDVPWDSIYLNGMVLDDQGRKMSKSRGNVVLPDEVLEEYPADAIRQGLLRISPGEDIPFSMKDVKYGSRFNQKVWNMSRFSEQHLQDFDSGVSDVSSDQLKPIDHWILGELDQYLTELESHIDAYRLDRALDLIYEFIWHTVADDYLEIVKPRLYDEEREKRGARATLYTVLNASIRSIAPFMPFIAEEIYDEVFDDRESVSIHGESWPTLERSYDETAAGTGSQAVDVISMLRQYKSNREIPLNEPLSELTIFAPDGFEGTKIVSDAMNVENMTIETEDPNIEQTVKSVNLDYATVGPEYGDDVKHIENRLESGDFEVDNGTITLELGDRTVTLEEGESYTIEWEFGIPGRAGTVIQEGDFAVLVHE
jgi:valyl-tRNA synthetase